jgi:CheY-like chemotaxis protein
MQSILLVEDSRLLRVMNERTLARAGYTVVSASDGEEGLRIARETRPDLILLDMLLPKMSGPEVLRALRTSPETATVPIIVLSSLPKSNEERLKKDGATAYLDKSSLSLDQHSDSLAEVVKKMLAKNMQQDDGEIELSDEP